VCVCVCVCVMHLLTHSPAISKYDGFRHPHAASPSSITNSTTVNRFSPKLSIQVMSQEVTRLLYNHVTTAPPHLGSPNYVLKNPPKIRNFKKVTKKSSPSEPWQLRSSLTSELDGGEWSTSHSGRFTPRERPPVPTEQETQWASGPVWTFRRTSLATDATSSFW